LWKLLSEGPLLSPLTPTHHHLCAPLLRDTTEKLHYFPKEQYIGD
jgi:hypothetical protein